MINLNHVTVMMATTITRPPFVLNARITVLPVPQYHSAPNARPTHKGFPIHSALVRMDTLMMDQVWCVLGAYTLVSLVLIWILVPRAKINTLLQQPTVNATVTRVTS